jgi:hypothetical protein
MATTSARRPLPALAFLVGLILLAAIVWWRVIHRTTDAQASPQPTATCTTQAATIRTVPRPSSVTVQVLNSTTRTGLAASVAKSLTALGFKMAGPAANDETSRAPVAGVAEVRFGPAGLGAATLLTYYLPGATLVADQRTTTTVDVALGAKFTTLPASAAITASLAAAHLAVSGSGPASTGTTEATPSAPATAPC